MPAKTTVRLSSALLTFVLLGLVFAGSASAATVGISLTSAPVEGSVRFTATGEVDSNGVLTAFVAPSGTQGCPGTMSEAESAFFEGPTSVGASFSDGFGGWIVQPGPILACAYDESFVDNTEGHAALSVDITEAPNTVCNAETGICTRTTTTRTPTLITTEICEESVKSGRCYQEKEAIGPVESPAPKRAGIVVRRASRNQLSAMASAANARHSGGFDASRYRLSRGKVTNNGWGTASWSVFPHGAQPESIVFHVGHGRWRVVRWGSYVCGPQQEAIPEKVCRVLGLQAG
jgi:hypothetical protein